MEKLPVPEHSAESIYIRAFFARIAVALLRERQKHGNDAVENLIEKNRKSLRERLSENIQKIKLIAEGIDTEVLHSMSEVLQEVKKLEMSPVVPGIENTTVLQRTLTSHIIKTINDSIIVPTDGSKPVCDNDIAVMLEQLNRFHLIFFDVNGLKAANDIGDHSSGDKVLQIFGLVAQEIALLDRNDTKTFHVFHKSGDEFVVLCENASEEEVSDFIQHVQSKYAQYDLIQDVFGKNNEKAFMIIKNILSSVSVDNDSTTNNKIDEKIPKVPLSVSAGTATIAQMTQEAAKRLAQRYGENVQDAITAKGSDLLPQLNENKEKDLQHIATLLASRIISIADVKMQSAKKAGKNIAMKKDPLAEAILSFGRGAQHTTTT